jgi:hypothetical protein
MEDVVSGPRRTERLGWHLQIMCDRDHHAGSVRVEMGKLLPFTRGESLERSADGTPTKLRVRCSTCSPPVTITRSWSRIQEALTKMKSDDKPSARLRVVDGKNVLEYSEQNN